MPKQNANSEKVIVQKFKDFDLQIFRSDLRRVNFDAMKSVSSDPKQILSIWRTLFLDVPNKHAPISGINSKSRTCLMLH